MGLWLRLVEQARLGDERAIADLIARFTPLALATARRFLALAETMPPPELPLP